MLGNLAAFRRRGESLGDLPWRRLGGDSIPCFRLYGEALRLREDGLWSSLRLGELSLLRLYGDLPCGRFLGGELRGLLGRAEGGDG